MGYELILKQLRHIINLLNKTLEKLDEITRPKSRNVAWRLLFPYGEFQGQKTSAKEASAIMLDVQARMDDMVQTLRKRSHPLFDRINMLNSLDLREMGEQLIDLPQRARYMGEQIEQYGISIKEFIQELEKTESSS
ncbi:MAG: hypothetical protein ACFFCH_00300 [Promethearchaeota archaeon]